MSLIRAAIWTHHPGDLLGQAIDFVTRGTAQHAGFIRENGQIHELYLPTLRDRDIIDAERPFLKIYDIEGLTPDLSTKLERHFDIYLTADIQYSITDLFRIVFCIPIPNEMSMCCSQYVFHMLKMIELPPLVRCDLDFISPRDLMISPNLLDIAVV